MNFFRTILLASVVVLNMRAAENATHAGAINTVIVSTDLIDRLVAEARTNNPSLKAADSRVRSATFNAESIRTWEDPMAMFGGSVFSDRGFNPSEEGDLIYGIEQKLPLWGRPKLMRQVAEAETAMRGAGVQFRAQQLRSEIIKALLKAAFAERVVEIDGQDLAWLNATANSVESKYRSGGAGIADTLQIQNEAAKRNDALRTDRLRLAHEHFTLNRLLNREVTNSWPTLRLPPVAPAIPLSKKLLALALQNEPKLKVLEQEIRQAAASAELAHNSRLPDVSFAVEGKQYHGDGEFRMGMFALRFSLPWGNAGKYRKDFEREKEKQKTSEHEREDQVLVVQEQLHHLSVEIEAMRREALLHDNEIGLRAGQALTSRLSEWVGGHGALRDVLDSRRMVLDSELSAARATAEEYQMLAEMLVWTGLENLEALTQLANEPSLLPDHEMHDRP